MSMARTHPAYPEEKSHLNATLDTLNRRAKASEESARDAKEAIRENRGLQSMHGASLAAHWYLQRADDLEEAYENIRKEAYHGRVDFSEGAPDEVETIYIGKRSLIDENGDVVIVDWREPISNLFVLGAAGSTDYRDNVGNTVRCHIYLKRVLKVVGEDISTINDVYRADGYGGHTETVAGDPYLLQILKQASSSRLRDIVATIQQEQNEIIRAPLEKLLVVQGVAGSGKTTVVLHRMAYLLYAYRKEISPEEMLVISPNKVFISYTSAVLPELGYKTIPQLTLEDFLLSVVNQKVKVRSRDAQYESLLSATPEEAPEEMLLTLTAVACQGRVSLTNILDRAIAAAIEAAIPKDNLVVEGQVLMTHPELQHRFTHDYSYLPPAERLSELKAVGEKAVQKFIQDQSKKIYADFEPLFDHAKGVSGQYAQQWSERLVKERDTLLTSLRTAAAESWEAYRSLFRPLDSVRIYRRLLSSVHLLWTYSQGKQAWDELHALAIKKQTTGMQEWDREDLACLAYISCKTKGFAHNYKYVAIDESQDLTPLEFHILHTIIGHSSMTIAGDINQSCYPGRLLPSWAELLEGTITSDDYVMATLSSSYRTTEQIALLANSVLLSPHFAPHALTPIPRAGPTPLIEQCSGANQRLSAIASQLRVLAGKHKNIGVVARTLLEAEELHMYFKAQGIGTTLIGAESQHYSGGVQVMSVSMAKGLELDAVIISNASQRQYPDDQVSARLFYIAITRAMHELYIYHDGDVTPLLKPASLKNAEARETPRALPEVAATAETQPSLAIPSVETHAPQEPIRHIDKWLTSHKCRITYDNTGTLWLLGGLEHKALVTEAGKHGFSFVYAHRGVEVTGYKPGWKLERKRL